MKTTTKNPAAVALGSSKSAAKTSAARENGKKGGRPFVAFGFYAKDGAMIELRENPKFDGNPYVVVFDGEYDKTSDSFNETRVSFPTKEEAVSALGEKPGRVLPKQSRYILFSLDKYGNGSGQGYDSIISAIEPATWLHKVYSICGRYYLLTDAETDAVNAAK